MIKIKYKYLNFSRALNFAAIQNSHWGLSLLLTEASSTSQNEKLCLLKVKCYLSFWLLKGRITLWKELKIFSFITSFRGALRAIGDARDVGNF